MYIYVYFRACDKPPAAGRSGGASSALSSLFLFRPSARGDLARVLGMRTVAFLGLVSEIDSDVGLSRKAKVVGGICFSTAMFWDSKYHVRMAR